MAPPCGSLATRPLPGRRTRVYGLDSVSLHGAAGRQLGDAAVARQAHTAVQHARDRQTMEERN